MEETRETPQALPEPPDQPDQDTSQRPDTADNAEAGQESPDTGRMESGPPKRPRRSSAGSILKRIVLLVILLALVATGWFGWQWWQQQQGTSAAAAEATSQTHLQQQAIDELRQQTSELRALMDASDQQTSQLKAQLGTDDGQLADLRSQLQATTSAAETTEERTGGLEQRVMRLESAVSSLSQHTADGAERMRLDDIEMLLTQAEQRYKLLHDGVSALAALRMARTQLAEVDDPALAGVARTLDDEISALAATRPDARASQLEQLGQLRQNWSSLPPKPIDAESDHPMASKGTWGRIWGALSTLVVVRRIDADGDDAVGTAKRQLAAQVAQIDLARAEASLLNNDPATALDAIRRTEKTLAAGYDGTRSAVKQAARQLAELSGQLSEAVTVDVQLGAALTALRNQRQVQEMRAAPTTAPVGQATGAGTADGA